MHHGKTILKFDYPPSLQIFSTNVFRQTATFFDINDGIFRYKWRHLQTFADFRHLQHFSQMSKNVDVVWRRGGGLQSVFLVSGFCKRRCLLKNVVVCRKMSKNVAVYRKLESKSKNFEILSKLIIDKYIEKYIEKYIDK